MGHLILCQFKAATCRDSICLLSCVYIYSSISLCARERVRFILLGGAFALDTGRCTALPYPPLPPSPRSADGPGAVPKRPAGLRLFASALMPCLVLTRAE